MFFLGIPLLIIPFAIYNMIAFITPGVSWQHEVMRLQMMSGGIWTLTVGEVLIAFSVLVLFVEVLKATRFGTRGIMDHLLSLVLFIVMLLEFLLVERAATGTLFLIMVISFVDVLAGFSVAVRAARRDIAVEPMMDTHTH
jgi:hypothetical protein